MTTDDKAFARAFATKSDIPPALLEAMNKRLLERYRSLKGEGR